MKTILVLLAACLLAGGARAADTLTEKLQHGLFEEEANRDLKAAIADYQSVVASADEQRKVVATAIFRLGECYRKLGRTNEAAAQYRRIVTDFSEQDALVKLSRQMTATTAPQTATADLTATQAALEKLGIRRVEQEARYKTLSALTRDELLRTLPSTENDPALADLRKQADTAEQKLGVLRQSFGEEHPDVVSARKLSQTIQKQIDERLSGVIAAAKLAVEQTDLQIKALKAQLATTQRTALTTNPLEESMTQAEAEELARVKTLARNSPDLLQTPNKGLTELQLAARNGHYSVAEFLLSQGVSAKEPEGNPPLITAAQLGHLRMVRLLLDKGADVDPKDARSGSALMQAVAFGFKSVAELLVERGADVNRAGSDGLTPLHLAARSGHASIAEFLLRHSAQPNALSTSPTSPDGQNASISVNGATPLQFAAGRGFLALAELLLKSGALVKATNYDLMTPLHFAAYGGHTNLCAMLLEQGADLNAQDSTGMTPLTRAIERRKLEAVELLVRHGADVNLPITAPVYDRYPISLAVQLGWLEIVKAVLANKPDLQVTNRNGQRPLYQAIRQNNGDIVEALLKAGADANQASPPWGLPLLEAAFTGRARIVESLLNHGANPNVQTAGGETPLSRARYIALQPIGSGVANLGTLTTELRAAYREIADLLQQHGADEFLQRRGFISVVRGPEQSARIFQRGTNQWNRHTLMELIGAVYENGGQDFPFPDFSKLTIYRLDGKTEKPFSVDGDDMLAVTNDCSKDIALEWGDNVEIPMADHAVNANWDELRGIRTSTLAHCLQRSVRLAAGSTNVSITLFYSPAAGASSPRMPGYGGQQRSRSPFFRLSFVLRRDARFQNLLRSSSDVSRVIVTRIDPATKESRKMIFDLNEVALPDMAYSSSTPPIPWQQDLWLRDGDVIEVPEKP